MTTHLGFLLACALGTGADKDDATKKEYARFEGVWSFSTVDVEGKRQPEAPFKTNKLIMWKEGRFIVVQGKRITHGSFKLNLAKSPKQIEVTITDGSAKGRTSSSIYELERDTYRFCGSLRKSEPPGAFVSEPEGGTILQVLKREKQDVKQARTAVGHQELTGTWQAVSYALDGDKATDEDTRKITLSIDAEGKATARRDGKSFIAGTINIDPTKEPMTMDVSYTQGDPKGKTALGIYKIEDDLLTICRTSPDQPRPSAFASRPGSGHTLMTYTRVKESPAAIESKK